MEELTIGRPYSWPGKVAIWRQDDLLLPQCFAAVSWGRRARGLIGRPPELAAAGLILVPCNSVHNMFMSYPIDLVFLDKEGTIIKVQENFLPWRPYAGALPAAATLELLAGRVQELDLKVGQKLTIKRPE